jgi:two-component system LytT family response regulator
MKDLIVNSKANKADYYLISKLPIVVKNEILLIPLSSILRMEADGSCTKIYTNSNKMFTVTKILAHYEKTLPNSFLRVHDKFIININFVEKIICEHHWSIELSDKTIIRISDTKKDLLVSALGLVSNEI